MIANLRIRFYYIVLHIIDSILYYQKTLHFCDSQYSFEEAEHDKHGNAF